MEPIANNLAAPADLLWELREQAEVPGARSTIAKNVMDTSIITRGFEAVVFGIDPPDPTRAELPNVGTRMVAPGHLFVLGDNRTHSVDSRNYGPVPFPVVRARVLAIVWPFSRARGLGPLRFDAEPR